MTKALLLNLLYWFVIWFVGWGVFFFVLLRFGVTYMHNIELTILYFLLFSALAFVSFKRYISLIVEPPTLASVVLLIGVFLVLYLGFYMPDPLRKILPWTEIQGIYFFTKIFELLFQQIMIVSLASFFHNSGVVKLKTLLSFTFIFVSAHVPLLFFLPLSLAVFFIVFSIFGGLVFYSLIMRWRQGYIYSYSIHLLFYMLTMSFFPALVV